MRRSLLSVVATVTLGVVAALAGCVGGNDSIGDASAGCATFAGAYPKFLAGTFSSDLPFENRWSYLGGVLEEIQQETLPPSGMDADINRLKADATALFDGSLTGQDGARALAEFNSDLAFVSKDCDTAFTPATLP